jgi:uncharacterized membrane protein
VLAFSEGVYDLLKYLHVVASVIWVGAGFFVQYYAFRLERADPSRVGAFLKDIEKAGPHLFLPASFVVLLTGLALVFYAPFLGFGDTWILLGIVGYAATAITGTFFLGPTSGKLGVAVEEQGPDSPEVKALAARIWTISRIDLVVLLLVIADMVFKPGA